MIAIFNGEEEQADLYENDMMGLNYTIKQINKQFDRAKQKHFNKDTWEIDLGDYLDKDMMKYHNLAMTQIKNDLGYQSMYKYFAMLKLFKKIH